jgi:hypothetical protein
MERYMIVLKSYKRMPAALMQALREGVNQITVRKHECIQPVGTVSDCLYFVEKGLLHRYVERAGKRITLGFKKEDNFINCLKEGYSALGKPIFGVEALEDSTLWCLPGGLIKVLKKDHPSFLFNYITIIEKDIIAIDEADHCSFKDAGEGNYDSLRHYAPDLLDRVPIRYLASYTGIPEKIFRHLHSSKIKLKVSTERRRRSRGKGI